MGTLRVPDIVPSPAQDCERLRKAFQGSRWFSGKLLEKVICGKKKGKERKGWGTDEKAIIWVLGHRNATQRRKIRETYQQLYNESLIDCLQSELSGDFGNAVILWTYDPPERDAKLANKALKAKKKDINQLQVIVELACASSPDHLMAVRQAYISLFDCSLEEDIVSNVSAPLQKVLVGLVRSYRYDREWVDLNVAKSEAAMLREAIEKKQLDDDVVVFILDTRNFFHLRATFECYKQDYGNSFEQDIKNCGKGDLESVLRVVTLCIDSPEKHFAQVIRTSIVGLGTDEDSLTRAIVTRAEIDTTKIRDEYLNMHKVSLDADVIADTSGDYKDFLMTLLGAKI